MHSKSPTLEHLYSEQNPKFKLQNRKTRTKPNIQFQKFLGWQSASAILSQSFKKMMLVSKYFVTFKADEKKRLSKSTSKAERSSQHKIHSTLKCLGSLFKLKAHHKN